MAERKRGAEATSRWKTEARIGTDLKELGWCVHVRTIILPETTACGSHANCLLATHRPLFVVHEPTARWPLQRCRLLVVRFHDAD